MNGLTPLTTLVSPEVPSGRGALVYRFPIERSVTSRYTYADIIGQLLWSRSKAYKHGRVDDEGKE
ncbi:hypothetical protein E2C01_054328 [Portunus trituberculatus]|uniref:Uncharacterized protein n=1 Tax=Portunus trituberculatus TaxID=210409 RepID=A0A5B7GRQ3_PORTR|nr:hypothetical protein [Portunus trituberculatus]